MCSAQLKQEYEKNFNFGISVETKKYDYLGIRCFTKLDKNWKTVNYLSFVIVSLKEFISIIQDDEVTQASARNTDGTVIGAISS